MPEEIPLRRLYENMVDSFPGYTHDEKSFLSEVMKVLLNEGIRTKGLRNDITKTALDYKLRSHYPLNDFYEASQHYLSKLGVPENQVNKYDSNSKHTDFFHDTK